MAHYALINEDNIVVQVIVGHDEYYENIDWESFYSDETGYNCLRTSYNTFAGIHNLGKQQFRKNYAGIGYSYDSQLDAFIPPKPYDSWVLNQESCIWESPISKPEDENDYLWNEEKISWERYGKVNLDGWVFDEELQLLVPPIPYPEDGKIYVWDSEENNWVLFTE